MQKPQRPDSGALFRLQDRKSDKHPEFEGEFSVCCPNCNATFGGWVKAWVKQGKESKFFSLAFKAKRPAGDRAPTTHGLDV